ncbi:MAG: hypothetical protein OCU12_07800 [Methanophagales archaeon]|nr:hypothetical protein [Methanophagales archaeon]
MTTLAEFRARCQVQLGDTGAATWPAATIDGWIKDGIRDYGEHFRQRLYVDIAAVAGQYNYTLPSDAWSILSVEYPKGEDPPVFLVPWRRSDKRFQNLAAYDFERSGSNAGAEVWLGVEPEAGKTIRVRYEALHDADLAAGDTAVLTLPAEHENLVLMFVVWRATLELQNKEQQNPTSNSSLLMSQLASNAHRLQQDYSNALQRALYSVQSDSGVVSWLRDDDRIY